MTAAIAVNAICAILRPMHFPRASLPAIYRLSRGALYTFCGFCALWCLHGGNVDAADAKTQPAAQSRPALPRGVDSYTITQRGDGYRINITCPQVGTPVADAELAIWARDQAAAFTESVQMLPTPPPVPYELVITYETLRASSRVISVVFFISTSMGGAHPEPGLATFVYDRRDGRRLSYNDLFLNQEGIVRTFSDICRGSLAKQLGDRVDPAMLDAGTTPTMANFDLFALAENGVRIFFPPYQIAPYSEGYLNVTIPLGDLAQFKPHLAFWDKP
ncbi:putative Endo-1,4-beta-xylanase-like protein [uncultured delta proteobacterium]|uniref:Putative Endo-1,4-beta-xylanase-like protein n=1 Tax=uncultured delta proteobacterium TaxID=34034 RepID=A0A212IZR3_9DELT|nr:putative Endo-1,4-beta-xylanase-like protein [uncultured delta proteobacterium]